MSKLKETIDAIIQYSFLILAAATPLIFSNFNTELYEVPKMHFVYLLSAVILFLTVAKFIVNSKITIPQNIALFTFAIFVIVQILSTLTSTDKFTSIFGFPTRLNGSLISQIAYLIIFASLLINLNFEKAKRVLIALVIAAFAVSVWGIPSHFGRDPSCLVLIGDLTSSCWKKEFDPALRIFSTMGQPNWLASYLILALPLSIAFLILSTQNNHKILFFASSVTIFWALILTNSRAGILGLSASLLIFLFLLGIENIRKNLKFLIPLTIIFLTVALIFQNTLTPRIKEAFIRSNQSTVDQQLTTNNQPQTAKTQTAVTAGGTESGQIRLILWKGAADVFKNYPILGSGPETFVSSYYKFRPKEQNQTTEWDFFYNKAHNEFLNYLANTGALGFCAYIAFLLTAASKLLKSTANEKVPSFLERRDLARAANSTSKTLLAKAILASIIGYLVSIFFGFSTVATQTSAFLIIASGLLIKNGRDQVPLKLNINEKFKTPLILLSAILFLILLSFILRSFLANVFEKRAENKQKILTAYSNAIKTYPVKNPYLLSNYSIELAQAAQAVKDPTDAEKIAGQANKVAKEAQSLSPQNFLVNQRTVKAYILLSTFNPQYGELTKTAGKKLIELAPTDPSSYLTNAKIQVVLENNKAAAEWTKKALDLKPDYVEAKELLKQLTKDN